MIRKFLLYIILASLCLSLRPQYVLAADQLTQHEFDIPAQPLRDALTIFSHQSGFAVVTDHQSTISLVSMAIKGTMPALKALRLMIGDANFQIREVDAHAIALIPVGETSPHHVIQPAVIGEALPIYTAVERRVFASLQSKLRQLLCAHAKIRPGPYRIIALLWIDKHGKVISVKTMASNAVVNTSEIDRNLMGLKLDDEAVTDLPQPIAIFVRPQNPDDLNECEASTIRG